jgi:hypothetical protein
LVLLDGHSHKVRSILTRCKQTADLAT